LALGLFFGPAKAAETEVMTKKAIGGMIGTEEIYSNIVKYSRLYSNASAKAARAITGLVELEAGSR
jgi:hypothetical protein